MLADWITINIPWYVFVLGFIGLAFWPLTGVTAIVGFATWRSRARLLGVAFLPLAALWAVSAFVNILPYVARIVETAQTRARHYGPGMVGDATLVRDTTIDGVFCSLKDPVRTDFLGKLEECTLARPSLVRGVPCTGRVNVEYRVRCTLAANYKRFGYVWRQSTLVIDNGSDDVAFEVGPQPPTLTVLGSPLPQKTEVQFRDGKLFSINFVEHPLRYRDCVFGQVLERDGGGFDANCTGGANVALPGNAIRS